MKERRKNSRETIAGEEKRRAVRDNRLAAIDNREEGNICRSPLLSDLSHDLIDNVDREFLLSSFSLKYFPDDR